MDRKAELERRSKTLPTMGENEAVCYLLYDLEQPIDRVTEGMRWMAEQPPPSGVPGVEGIILRSVMKVVEELRTLKRQNNITNSPGATNR